MTPQTTPAIRPADSISLDDLRHKALAIKQEVRDEVEVQVSSRRNQLVLAGVVVVAVAFGVAYYVGTRAGRAAASEGR